MTTKSSIITACVFVLGLLIGTRYLSSENSRSSDEVHGGITSQTTDKESEQDLGYQARTADNTVSYLSDEMATISLFEEAAPSVVYITTSQVTRSRFNTNLNEIPQGSGSGFIWDDQGHIVTNFHVIEGSNRVSVTLSNQLSYPATFIGAAPNKDLAVLKIDATYDNLTPIPIGRSSNLLGIDIVDNSKFSESGAMIRSVGENSPAQKAGLKGVQQDQYGRMFYGDIIKKINGNQIKSSGDITPLLEKFNPGDKVTIEFVRQSETYTTELVLGSSVNQ